MNGKFFRFFKEYDSLFSIGEKLYITLNTILILFGASGVSAIIAIIDPKKPNININIAYIYNHNFLCFYYYSNVSMVTIKLIKKDIL